MRQNEGDYVFCTEYRHYLTGKIMRAKDYGYKCWHFLSRRKK